MTAATLQSVPLKLHDKSTFMTGKGDAKDLPEGFAPSEFDVLVGWARQNFHHAGNRRFRDIISENVPRYMRADSKISRGQIITDIVREIQKQSPSGTGFLKMNPYTAKWNFIGTDKAKDKVGHALRKAVMSAQGGGGNCDDSSGSKQQEDEQSQVNDSDERTNNSAGKMMLREQSAGCPSSPQGGGDESSNKQRQMALSKKRKGSPQDGPISILKKLGTSKYGSNHAGLRIETIPLRSATHETDMASFSKFFSSPAASTTTMMMRQPTSSDTTNFALGLSPVARDMFDEKNEINGDAMSRRRARGKKLSDHENTGNDATMDRGRPESLPLHLDHNSTGDSSYPDHRGAIPVHHHHVPPSAYPPVPPPPPLHPMYHGAPPLHHPHQGNTSSYYYHHPPPVHHVPPQPPHAMIPPSIPFPPPPQQPLIPGQPQGIVMSPRQGASSTSSSSSNAMTRDGVDQKHHHYHHHLGPNGLMIPPPPPPPPSMVPPPGTGAPVMAHPPPGMYFPPGYYYYPGFVMPSVDASGASGGHQHHHPVVPQAPSMPGNYNPGGVSMVDASYYNQQHEQQHYNHDEEEEEGDEQSHGSPQSTPSP